MFDSTLNPLWQRYILAVQEEVKPALGCTEPISLALAAAVAAAELEGPVERVEAWVSPKSGTVRSGRVSPSSAGIPTLCILRRTMVWCLPSRRVWQRASKSLR